MTEIAFPLFRSLGRGLAHKCPACGQGRLYGRYLKVQPDCGHCDHPLSRYPADDGPAYLTILLIGHLIIAPLLIFPIVWEAPAYYSLPILLSSISVVTLAVLPGCHSPSRLTHSTRLPSMRITPGRRLSPVSENSKR